MTEKLVKLDVLHQEALHRIAEIMCEKRNRPDLIAAMEDRGATVTLAADGNYVVTVAGEEAARVEPWTLAALVARVEAGRALPN